MNRWSHEKKWELMVFRVQTDRLGPWWLPKRASTLQEETSKVNFHASEAVKSRPKKIKFWVRIPGILGLCRPVLLTSNVFWIVSGSQQNANLGTFSSPGKTKSLLVAVAAFFSPATKLEDVILYSATDIWKWNRSYCEWLQRQWKCRRTSRD